MEAVFGILALIGIGLITWWDWENPDKKSGTVSSFSAETTLLNDQRKKKQIAKLEEKINKLNEENPGQLYYRTGARIKKYSPEQVAQINFTKAEYERLNAPYAPHQRHYEIRDGELIHVSEERVKSYKFQEKMRKFNRDYGNGITCRFDHLNMKLIDNNTDEEIPFNPDEYTLTGD